MDKNEFTDNQKNIIKLYKRVLKKKKFKPSYADFYDFGITKASIKSAFVSLKNLTEILRKSDPKAFKDIVDEALFTKENHTKITDMVKDTKRFFITTAVAGCKVDSRFLASINNYCKRNKAELLVLPCADPSSGNGWELDPALSGKTIVFDNLALNNNLFISSIELSAKHIDPTTGLDRIGQRNGSFIYASPKQRMKPVAVGNNKLPHVLMTTGSITKPEYYTDRYMSKRTSYIANHDHVMGGIIVEVENDNSYYFRQVQSNGNGEFIDLGSLYSSKSCKKINAAAFVEGDRHAGETDPNAEKVWAEVVDIVKPEYYIVHDVFNGYSINHHTANMKLTSAKIKSKVKLTAEMDLVVEAITRLAKKSKVVIVKSNHDEWLDRYLETGLFLDDADNIRLCLELSLKALDGKDPLQAGIDDLLDSETKKRVRWLGRDESFKIARIELGAHGDKGPNGSRGSINGLEKAYGNCVIGHSHSPQILRGAWQVGTSTFLKVSYNKGPSSWMQTSCIVYPNGSRQLIHSVEGKWRLKDGKVK